MIGQSWIETTMILSTLAGGLVLAGWALWKEHQRHPASPPGTRTAEPDSTPPSGASPQPRQLARALLLLGGGLAFHYLFAGRHPRWALLAYLPMWAGIAVLVVETVSTRRTWK